MDCAEGFARAAHDFFAIGLARNIGDDCRGFAARALNLRDDLTDFAFRARGYHDGCTFGSEPARDGSADAPAASGYDCNLSLELHRFPPWSEFQRIASLGEKMPLEDA